MHDDLNFSPLNDWALIFPEEETKLVAGFIAIPDQAIEKPSRGEVIKVGPGRLDEKMQIEIGEGVLFKKHGTVKINLNNNDYILVSVGHMMGRYKIEK